MKTLLTACAMLAITGLSAQTKFGALLDPGAVANANEHRVAVAKKLGISIIRDHIVLTNPREKSMLNLGFDVFTNINYGNVMQGGGVSAPVPFPTDLNAYTQLLKNTMAGFTGKKPVVIAIENEEDNLKYHSGSAQDYINELKAAIPIVHAAGIKVTNAGITSQATAFLVYNDMMAHGRNAEAQEYKQDVQVNFNAPYIQRKADFLKQVIAAYKTLDIDYINFHWYGKSNNTKALEQTINYLQAATGKPVVTNEIGQYDNSPETVRAIIQTCRKEKMPYVIWYSGLKGGGKAVSLQNADGTLKENGEAFRAAAAGQ